MAAETKRTLAHLLEHGSPPTQWRDWLDAALEPVRAYSVHNFLRHGRQRTDGCELVLIGPDGQRHAFEIDEQRLLSTPNTLRATLVSATDGLIRMRPMTKPELEDIWVALVTLATVTANQSQKDETREWLEQTIEQTEEVIGYSMVPAERPVAIQALLDRNRFDHLAAKRFIDPKESNPARPALLIDDRTGERWMRVSELGRSGGT